MEEKKTLEITSFLYTHISSMGYDEMNENLTNLKNKTGLVLTTGATATRASYKLLAQMTTWNKMAAYGDANAADLLPDNIYNDIFKETDTKQMENYKI